MRVADGDGGFTTYWPAYACMVLSVACLGLGLFAVVFVKSTQCRLAIDETVSTQHALMEAQRDLRIEKAFVGDPTRAAWTVGVLSVLDSITARDGRMAAHASLVRLEQ